MKATKKINAKIQRIREILTPEVPHLLDVGYQLPWGYYFTLDVPIQLDIYYLEKVLAEGGIIDLLSVVPFSKTRYIISTEPK